MVWLCIYSTDKIQVYNDEFHIGDYELLKEPYCERCSSPGVTIEECLVRDRVFDFNRVYAVGEYTARAGRPYPTLTTHIRYLKDFNKIQFAIPLGYALYTVMKKKISDFIGCGLCCTRSITRR